MLHRIEEAVINMLVGTLFMTLVIFTFIILIKFIMIFLIIFIIVSILSVTAGAGCAVRYLYKIWNEEAKDEQKIV